MANSPAPDPLGVPAKSVAPLDRAIAKAYRRLLPLLFISYVIAYVDRSNVSLAKLEMQKFIPGFDDAAFGFGAGIFFIGYFLLEIPGTLLVEKWSARKWISRIMITWGFLAAATAFVKTPSQFYGVRFLLGLAEAGFFPGVIVYLSHWFPTRHRARAMSYFFVATPMAQLLQPKVSYYLLRIGTDEVTNGVTTHYPALGGLLGWQWMFIAWGLPAVLLGVLVLAMLTDRPGQANWLDPDERAALEKELADEKAHRKASGRHMTLLEALGHPKVLFLAAAYFFINTTSYGIEMFMPTVLKGWFKLNLDQVTWALTIPPLGGLLGQLIIGWNSDRTTERRLHASLPMYLGGAALACTLLIPQSPANVAIAVATFSLVVFGIKGYLPAFWTLPGLFLTEAAAAGSIGFINSTGNLGGAVGPYVMGILSTKNGSFTIPLLVLSASMAVSATIILALRLGGRTAPVSAEAVQHTIEETETLIEPA